MERYAVIGAPVAHSLSPRLFQVIAQRTGRALQYECRTVREEELPSFLAEAKRGAYRGVNVTMPLKTRCAALAEERTAEAEALSAANVLRFANGRAFAHNTDGDGFLLSLQAMGVPVRGEKTMLIGAGGAARAIALALAKSGAEVHILNRTAEQAAALTALHENICLGSREDAASCALVINATPQGMTCPWGDLSFVEMLPSSAAVIDCVYQPRTTELMKAAAARGIFCRNGLGMLAGQAIRSAEFFFGEALNAEELFIPLLHAAEE